MSRSDILSLFNNHGILPTPQRIEVAGALLERPRHLSAEQLLDELRDAGSGVSKATVYNTLKLFGDRGLIREIMVDPVRKFYDSTTHAHHHFYNVDTGELGDIDCDEMSFQDIPPLPEGTELESIEVIMRVRDKHD